MHLAPAFGEIDRQIGRDNGLPSLNPVGPDGRFTADIDWLAGREVRAANPDINDRLESTGLLIRRAPYVHSYPHCWRCRTPLIYWGKPSWYIATSTRKDDLLAANETVDWHPGYIKEGRFGEWLANNVDWALSRDRYWGTPLPIWRCGRGHLRCVGSLAELSDLTGRDVTGVDPHRPTIDEVTFACSTCGAEGTDDELAVMPARRAGDRRLVRLGLHAGGAGGLPARAGVGRGVHLPGRLHLRGHRPDAGLVLLAARRQRRSSSARAPTATSSASATSSTPTVARCPSRSATSSTPGRFSTPGARTPCGGGCSARVRPGPRRGPRSAPSTRPCATCC